MKKLAVIFAFIMLTTGISSAQFFTFGVKGGLNYSKLSFDKINNISTAAADYNLMQDESFQSFHAGVFARVKLFNAFLQPELYFNTAGGKVLIEEFEDGTKVGENVKKVTFSKIDLPVLVGLKFGPARINAGPVASVVLSEDNAIGDIVPELETLSKGATIGLQAGVGIDILKFLTVDYRYETGLSKWGDQLTIAGEEYPFDSRANMHMVSLGIMF